MRPRKGAEPDLRLSWEGVQATRRKVAGLGIEPSTCVWVVHRRSFNLKLCPPVWWRPLCPLLWSSVDRTSQERPASSPLPCWISKREKTNWLWNHRKNIVVNCCIFLEIQCNVHSPSHTQLPCHLPIPMQMYLAREFVRPAVDEPSERWTLTAGATNENCAAESARAKQSSESLSFSHNLLGSFWRTWNTFW